MDLEKVGKISYQFALSVIEWGFKICAIVAGMIALAANGSIGNKIAAGFSSLPEGIRALCAFPASFRKMSWTAREYQEMGGVQFEQAYGTTPLNQLIHSLSGHFTFFHDISNNLAQAPFVSFIAALSAFICFYMLARIIRFARQRGKGSYLSQIELELGDRVFNRRERLKEKVQEFAKRQKAPKRMGQSSPKLT